MPIDNGQNEFPSDINAAFDNYATPQLSRGFEAQFWAQFETRRGRYRGFTGALRRLWEVEIEGVAVWRLLASTFSGAATCALFLAFAVGSATSEGVPITPTPPPQQEGPLTALNAYAFYRREWEGDFLPQPKPRAAPPRAPKNGGNFSWTGSNARLA